MRGLNIFAATVLALIVVVSATAQNKRTVIQVSTLLDGRGAVIKDTRIVIEGNKIVRIDPKATPVDYDLRGFTVLPGWIDSHVHITWHFGPEGKNAGQLGANSVLTKDVERTSRQRGAIERQI